ncbi:hypothetical protein GJ744_009898 [Endocarpon pusillum]|uniref:Uncharacterized protein n=1 Tax=Endocarpon pusillum TaxID=364733 RepID=A0A8H7E5X9_9EURO|nr:hypothetical protein GJ744_009898 [Endocarpon pusillum]
MSNWFGQCCSVATVVETPVPRYEGVDVLNVNATFGDDSYNLLLESIARDVGVEHRNNGGWIVVPVLQGSEVE